MFAEAFYNFKHSTRLIPESQSCTSWPIAMGNFAQYISHSSVPPLQTEIIFQYYVDWGCD
jgi:hypothetical protein